MNIDSTFVNTAKLQGSDVKSLNVENAQDANLKKVCDDFESFFTQQLLDISLKSSNIAGEGTGSDIIKGMYTEAVSKSSAGTFGISDMLYNFLSENNK